MGEMHHRLNFNHSLRPACIPPPPPPPVGGGSFFPKTAAGKQA